jgi:hypothetical protein
LIRETFLDRLCFAFTGYAKITTAKQLFRFNVALREYGEKEYPVVNDWFAAFDQLRDMIENSSVSGKKVIFLDEMPWMDTRKSDFLIALEGFWNGWASGRSDILLIACGSATSWIVKKLFRNQGGLHNRVTRRIYLEPFTLGECEEFFASKGIVWTRIQILECYMIFGGIPFYLDMLDGTYSVAQNVDILCSGQHGELADEYQSLYGSLFANPERYLAVVEALSEKSKGLSRNELSEIARISNGGTLTNILDDLVQCEFIRRYRDFGKRSKDSIYQLTDPFTLYYLKFMSNQDGGDEHFWINNLQSGMVNAWRGFSFEMVCLWHTPQIKRKLGISGVSTNIFAWRSKTSDPGTQIDLIIDRKDGVINLCEIKYSNKPFTISKDYDEKLALRSAIFQDATHTTSALHNTFISIYGLAKGGYHGGIQSQISIDDLFESPL